MSQNVLAKVRIWTILIALPLAVVFWLAISFDFGAGVLLTALWAVLGFWILERLLRAAVVRPGAPRNKFAIALWVMAKFGVYGLAVWMLFSRPFPAISHAVGFTVLMFVLVVVGAQHRAEEIRLATARQDQSAGQAQSAEGDL